MSSIGIVTALWTCRYSRSELEAIDSEGRCVITEHGGQLVVFNVYLPATTRSGVQGAVGDRYEYKLRMLQARCNLEVLKVQRRATNSLVKFNI